jgi:hypothetical protein
MDPALFMQEIVGTDGEVTTDEVTFQLRNVIVSRFSNSLASSGIPVLDLAANTDDLAEFLKARVKPELAQMGIETPELFVENISLPEEVEQALDKRTSMGVIGDLGKYSQFHAAEAMRAAAENPSGGGGMGAGLGMGMGMAMANQMGQMSPWGQPQQPTHAAPPPPPPPPPERLWHVAVNGQTTGPFGRGDLGRMVAEGSFTRETTVWSQGYAGWIAAGEVNELAQLFTVAPPPPPPA